MLKVPEAIEHALDGAADWRDAVVAATIGLQWNDKLATFAQPPMAIT